MGPYSHSRINTFKKCKAKYKFAYIDKVEVNREYSPAMERGTKVHKSLEMFMQKGTELLHPDIHKHYGQFFFGIRENYTVQPEAKWAFTWDWKPCDYDDKDCMIRGFMDLKFVPEDEAIQVFEYKTGKKYEDHADQRFVYGLAALLQHPDKEGVDVTTIYLDGKFNDKVHYAASMLDNYKFFMKEDIDAIENCEDFIPEPQFGCRWCPYRRTNGGPCQF